MNREAELIVGVGEPLSWEYLSYGGRDSHVFASYDGSKVIKFYPYLNAGDLHVYGTRSFLAATKLFMRWPDHIEGATGKIKILTRGVPVQMVGEAMIGGESYGYTVSQRIYGPDISQVAGTGSASEYYQDPELVSFLQLPDNIKILSSYLAILSSYISGNITMGNAKIIEESRVNYLYVTDMLAKIGSKGRFYRNPIDVSQFGY